jgi:CRISPR system subtype II-B RNA-guided endonuclease Cas9/Csx12
MRKKIISPISIDLGGKYTGVYLPHYEAAEDPAHGEKLACVLTLPEDTDGLTYSQSGRTANRHRVRNSKRKKLAKRLMKVILEQGLEIRLEPHQQAKINGYLNRRGYSRVESDIDLSVLDACEPDYFADKLPGIFNSIASLGVQFDTLIQDVALLRGLTESGLFHLGKKTFKDGLKEECNEQDSPWEPIKISIEEAYAAMLDTMSGIIDEQDFGNFHRKEYISHIRADICANNPLQDSLSPNDLTNLIGHVSNLQLRALRWYFDDKEMMSGDKWKPEKLKSVLIGWVKYWHPKGEDECRSRMELQNLIEASTDILKTLAALDPETSIPPYEDMNNRRPPKDQTLWLSPESLTNRFPKWRIWAQQLRRKNAQLAEGLDALQTDRKSRPADNLRRDSYFLQRVLERSSPLDRYKLRLLVKGGTSVHVTESTGILDQDLGSQHRDEFLKLAGEYYAEVRQAQQGIWLASSDNLLERADLNPPQKRRILNRLVGAVLGMGSLSAADYAAFKESCWLQKSERSTLRGLCKAVEDCRKKHGNLFNEKLRRLIYRNDVVKNKKRDKDEKEIWGAYEKSLSAARVLQDYFKHTEDQLAYYDNPYSIAQLYTLIETEIHGFSRSTLAAHIENSWRMEKEIVDPESNKSAARCSRLPADSVRPFDGVLRRLLERQAVEISRIKAAQVIEKVQEPGELVIPLLIEENRFSFSLELNATKKGGDKNKLEKHLNTVRGEWDTKDQRIINASAGICPYTGNNITATTGEIDHILPQSKSRRSAGTVYNSEANLIYCSRTGNQDKDAQRYVLANLSTNYLQAIYGTDNVAEITSTIQKTVGTFGGEVSFVDLSDEQQRDLRHALFLPEDDAAFQAAFRLLGSHYKTRVNGTQAWLLKRLMELLRRDLQAHLDKHNCTLTFVAGRLDAYEVSLVRRQLGEFNPQVKKTAEQPIASHAVDALCVMAVACNNPQLAEAMSLPENGLSEDTKWLNDMLPKSINLPTINRQPITEKKDISGRKLFKDSLYAEHFVPIHLKDGHLYVGFDVADNAIKLEKGDPAEWLKCLEPFLRYKKTPLSECSDRRDWLKTGQPYRYLTIDKPAAFDHLHQVDKALASEEKIVQAELLDALRYVTSKAEIKSSLLNGKSLPKGDAAFKFHKKDKVLDNDKFTINIKSCDVVGNTKLSGKLELPAKVSWESLCADAKLTPLFENSVKVDSNFWRDLFHNHFKHSSSALPDPKHKKTRRQYSLPVIAPPAGSWCRIRRRTPCGNTIYQLQVANGSFLKGHRVTEEGEIDIGSEVLDAITNSPDVVRVGVSKTYRQPAPPEEVVSPGEWRWISLEKALASKGIKCAYQVNTKDRFKVRLYVPLSNFCNIINEYSKEINLVENVFGLPKELFFTKDSEDELWKQFPGIISPRPPNKVSTKGLELKVKDRNFLPPPDDQDDAGSSENEEEVGLVELEYISTDRYNEHYQKKIREHVIKAGWHDFPVSDELSGKGIKCKYQHERKEGFKVRLDIPFNVLYEFSDFFKTSLKEKPSSWPDQLELKGLKGVEDVWEKKLGTPMPQKYIRNKLDISKLTNVTEFVEIEYYSKDHTKIGEWYNFPLHKKLLDQKISCKYQTEEKCTFKVRLYIPYSVLYKFSDFFESPLEKHPSSLPDKLTLKANNELWGELLGVPIPQKYIDNKLHIINLTDPVEIEFNSKDHTQRDRQAFIQGQKML